MPFKSIIRVAGALAVAGAVATAALAQPSYPTKPVHLVVGFPPGGGVDILARLISQPLSERLGQPVIVDNKPGAGGNIAAEQVAHGTPDGQTLLVTAVSTLAISASLYKHPRYDVLKDFAPVAVIASVPNVLVVNPSVPAKNVRELIALAKAKPGRLNFASAGEGTTVHLAGELFKSMTKIDIVHVPYKGAAPAMSDLLGGQVQMMFDFLSAAEPHIANGQLRALGVTSATRSPVIPNVPTIAEAGVPGYQVLGNFGIVAPAGTPPEIVAELNKDIGEIVNMPEVKKRMLKYAATPEHQTPAEFADSLKAEVAKWKKIIDTDNIHID